MTKQSGPRDAGYLERARRHAGREFLHGDELGWLVSATTDPARRECFDQALFLSAFIRRARGTLARAGSDGEDTAGIRSELTDAVMKVADLLGKLNGGEDAERQDAFRTKYLLAGPDSFVNLQGLIEELAMLKSFELDGG